MRIPYSSFAVLTSMLSLLLGSAANAATYQFKQAVPGLAVAAAAAPVNGAPAPSVVGDGVSKVGACASGGASGCATWSSTGSPSNVIIGRDHLTVQADGMGATRATVGKTTDKWYWEVQLVAASDALLIGTGTGALSLNNPFTSTPPMWSWYSTTSPGNAKICGAWQGGSVYATTPDVVGVALDMTNHSVTYYKNGTPAITCTNVTTSEAVYPVLGDGGLSIRIKANFGQSDFYYPVPAGFNAGLW